MQRLLGFLVAFSVLVPQKVWFSPSQPLTVMVGGSGKALLTLTDFSGKTLESASANSGQNVDLKSLFTQTANPGTYVVWDGTPSSFAGTPLVVEVRVNKEQGAPPGPMVVKIEPLSYAIMDTDSGKMTMAFYYDVAPNTVDNFLELAAGGYYDGLTFHRIVPGFVIQGGDPRGDGTGGPGYSIPAEFNDHPHLEGVLSMARESDPNSGGSQFFVCLDYTQTQHLDGQYTAFGRVTDGMGAVKAIAGTPLADPDAGRPVTPPVIHSITVMPVTTQNDPYTRLWAAAASGK